MGTKKWQYLTAHERKVAGFAWSIPNIMTFHCFEATGDPKVLAPK